MKPFLPLALAAMLFAISAQAQQAQNTDLQETPPTASAAELAQSSQQALQEARDLVRVDALWSEPLDFEELGSSTADIAAHIKKALGPQAPAIEVRAKDTSRSTFTLKAAPLGPTLSSVATLNSYRVWVFPGRLLLSSQEALTPAEQEAVKEHRGGEWKYRSRNGGDWSSLQQLEKVAVPVIMADFKEHMAAKGVTAPPPPAPSPEANAKPSMQEMFRKRGLPPLPYSLPFTELGLFAQTLLKELVEAGSSLSSDSVGLKPKAAVLDETATVSFDDTRPSLMELRLESPFAKAPGGRRRLGQWVFPKPRPDRTR